MEINLMLLTFRTLPLPGAVLRSYMREFPTSWRDLDHGIEEIHQS